VRRSNLTSPIGAQRPDLDTILHLREQSGECCLIQSHPDPGIFREHLATVCGQEGLQHFALVFLRWLDFALFEEGKARLASRSRPLDMDGFGEGRASWPQEIGRWTVLFKRISRYLATRVRRHRFTMSG